MNRNLIRTTVLSAALVLALGACRQESAAPPVADTAAAPAPAAQAEPATPAPAPVAAITASPLTPLPSAVKTRSPATG